jgi:hypothetical protein
LWGPSKKSVNKLARIWSNFENWVFPGVPKNRPQFPHLPHPAPSKKNERKILRLFLDILFMFCSAFCSKCVWFFCLEMWGWGSLFKSHFIFDRVLRGCLEIL